MPIVEYRPYRSFSSNQSSTLLFQLFAGVDVPSGGTVIYAQANPAELGLDPVWSIGLKFNFDWRYYY